MVWVVDRNRLRAKGGGGPGARRRCTSARSVVGAKVILLSVVVEPCYQVALFLGVIGQTRPGVVLQPFLAARQPFKGNLRVDGDEAPPSQQFAGDGFLRLLG